MPPALTGTILSATNTLGGLRRETDLAAHSRSSAYVFTKSISHLHRNELVALLFEARDDLADKLPLDAVGLDGLYGGVTGQSCTTELRR